MHAILTATIVMALSAQLGQLGQPVPGLTDAEMARFKAGEIAFAEQEEVADGLGPVFNARSCAACHNTGGVGGPGLTVETLVGAWRADGTLDRLVNFGGPVIQTQGIGAGFSYTTTATTTVGIGRRARTVTRSIVVPVTFLPEVVPPQANVVIKVRTTQVVGAGWKEAVATDSVGAVINWQAAYAPEVLGHPPIVVNGFTGLPGLGRFGVQGQIATAGEFARSAYLNEMGITTSMFAADNPPQGPGPLPELMVNQHCQHCHHCAAIPSPFPRT